MPEASWTLVHYDRPWTLNGERSGHWRERHDFTKLWRGAFNILAVAEKLPKGLPWIGVDAQPYTRSEVQADTGACFGAVKAAIDGLRDARVIAEDTGDIVHWIKLLAPSVHPQGKDCLVLRITSEVP